MTGHISSEFFDRFSHDAAVEYVDLEVAYVHALSEAITYRNLFQLSLARIAELTTANQRLRQRVKQAIGVEAWSGEDDDGAD